jgi:hypothetical protein
MAFRREVFRLTRFHPELYGERTLGDGESGLNEDLRRMGALVGYEPAATVLHRVGRARMSVRYIRKWAWHLSGSLMYQRWKGRRRSLTALAGEVRDIVSEHWGSWLRSLLQGGGHSREDIERAFNASVGYGKLAYVYWMLRDPFVRELLDRDEHCGAALGSEPSAHIV